MAKRTKTKPAPKKADEVLNSLDDERKAAGVTLSNAQLEFIAKFVKALG